MRVFVKYRLGAVWVYIGPFILCDERVNTDPAIDSPQVMDYATPLSELPQTNNGFWQFVLGVVKGFPIVPGAIGIGWIFYHFIEHPYAFAIGPVTAALIALWLIRKLSTIAFWGFLFGCGAGLVAIPVVGFIVYVAQGVRC